MEIGKIKAVSEAFDKANDGEWIESKSLPGVSFFVRGMSSPTSIRCMSRLQRAAGDDMRDDDGMLTEEGQDAVDHNLVLEAGLIGWKGLTDDGKEVEYSPEMAETLMGHSMFATAVRVAMFEATKGFNDQAEALLKN
jgi:hypothetical protein